VTQASPDILVIIDSRILPMGGKRVRARDASIPIVDYVSPSVWAWRPGRARAMLSYVDHVLALLPFEPRRIARFAAAMQLCRPSLIEQIGSLRPGVDEQKRRDAQPPVLLVLPGSRRSEINHHMAYSRDAGRAARAGTWPLNWSFRPCRICRMRRRGVKTAGAAANHRRRKEKRAAFRIAHAAFAKSGTATLELALEACRRSLPTGGRGRGMDHAPRDPHQFR